MTIESATYIDELVSNYPADGDVVLEGDNQIRLIKAVLLASLPNISGAMNASDVELNYLAGSQAFIGTLLQAANTTAAHAALGTETLITGTKRTFVKPQGISTVNLGDVSGSVALDVNEYSRFRLRITNNTTLTLSGTPQAGNYQVVVEWGGAGYTLTLPFDLAATATPSFTTTNGAVSIIVADYDDVDDYWRYTVADFSS